MAQIGNSVDRFNGVVTSLAIKVRCVVAAITEIPFTSGAPDFPASVNGVALSVGDRVLLTAQTNAIENGIWEVPSTGLSCRAPDWDGSRDIERGTIVFVGQSGGMDDALWQVTAPASGPILVGTDPVTIENLVFGAAGATLQDVTSVGNTTDQGIIITDGGTDQASFTMSAAGLEIAMTDDQQVINISGRQAFQEGVVLRDAINLQFNNLLNDGNMRLGASATNTVAFDANGLVTRFQFSNLNEMRLLGPAGGGGADGSVFTMEERDTVLNPLPTPIAGFGYFWIRDDAPNVPMFTDDTGVDYQLNVGGTVIGDIPTATPPTTEAITALLTYVDSDQTDTIATVGFNAANQFEIRNEMRGGEFNLRLQNAAGDLRNPIFVDPAAAVRLDYPGFVPKKKTLGDLRRFETANAGIRVYGSADFDGDPTLGEVQDTSIDLLNNSGAFVGNLGFATSGALEIFNQVRGSRIDLYTSAVAGGAIAQIEMGDGALQGITFFTHSGGRQMRLVDTGDKKDGTMRLNITGDADGVGSGQDAAIGWVDNITTPVDRAVIGFEGDDNFQVRSAVGELWLRNNNGNNNPSAAITGAGLAIYGPDTGVTQSRLEWRDLAGFALGTRNAYIGPVGSNQFDIVNELNGRPIRIASNDTGGTLRTILNADPDSTTVLRADTDLILQGGAGAAGVRVTAAGDGQLETSGTRRVAAFSAGAFIQGPANNDVELRLADTGSNARATLGYNTGDDFVIQQFVAGGDTIINGVSDGDLLFQTGSVTRMQIDPTNSRFVFNDFSIFIEERADALPDVAGYGQLWVDNVAPNVLYFTDDAGNDQPLSIAFTATEAGLVPASGGGSVNFLRADGSWSTPAGTGAGITGTPVDNQIAVWDSANSIEGVASLTFDGTKLRTGGVFALNQRASAPADVADDGQIWLEDENPQRLAFTNDDGEDVYLHPVTVRKTADENVNNSTAFQDDDHLVISNLPAGQYRLDMLLRPRDVAVTGCGMRLTFSATSVDSQSMMHVLGDTFTGAAAPAYDEVGRITDTFDAIPLDTGSGTSRVMVTGYFRSFGGGSIQFRWAQNTAQVGDLRLEAQSFLSVTQLGQV